MRKIVPIFLLILLLSTCKKDKRERLFEIQIPNITFDIPAGLSGVLPRVFELDNLTTGTIALAKNANVDTALITEIRPVAATLSSIQGNGDYSFLREVAIRVCRSKSQQCFPTDEAFNISYYDDRRIGSRINMNPSLPQLAQNLDSRPIQIGNPFLRQAGGRFSYSHYDALGYGV